VIGRTISHYRMIEKLGGGGMGVPYKGEEKLPDRETGLINWEHTRRTT
jgi:hypothetical protein